MVGRKERVLRGEDDETEHFSTRAYAAPKAEAMRMVGNFNTHFWCPFGHFGPTRIGTWDGHLRGWLGENP